MGAGLLLVRPHVHSRDLPGSAGQVERSGLDEVVVAVEVEEVRRDGRVIASVDARRTAPESQIFSGGRDEERIDIDAGASPKSTSDVAEPDGERAGHQRRSVGEKFVARVTPEDRPVRITESDGDSRRSGTPMKVSLACDNLSRAAPSNSRAGGVLTGGHEKSTRTSPVVAVLLFLLGALSACAPADLSDPSVSDSMGDAPSDSTSGGASAELSAAVAADLTFIRQEEKLARDVYLTLFERWGRPASRASRRASSSTWR